MKQLSFSDFASVPPSSIQDETLTNKNKLKKGANYLPESSIQAEEKQQSLEGNNDHIPKLFSKVRITITKESDKLSYNYFIAYYPYVLKEPGEIMKIFKAQSGRELCKVFFNGNVHIFGLDEVQVIDD